MFNTSKFDPITGSIQQPFWRMIIAVPIYFGILGYLIGSFPEKISNWQDAGNGLAVLGFLISFWMNYRPSLLAKTLLYVCMALMFSMISIRSFGYIFPSQKLIWEITIVTSVVTSFLSPVFNQSFTSNLKDKISSPKNLLVKKLLLAFSFLGPLAGVTGTFFGLISSRNNMTTVQAVFLGLLSWVLAVSLPFSTSYPLYSKRESR